jgi:transcriptional regulator GlxA family with amidase domain
MVTQGKNGSNIVYGLLIYEQVGELDFAGPHGVFSISAMLQKGTQPITIGKSDTPITGIGNLKILPEYTFDTAPEIDVLLVPGSATVQHVLDDNETMEWIKEQSEKISFTAAVCSGALILQKAGLLKNRKATTHWQEIETLKKDPGITVLPEMRYVRDGNIITSQGVSAGIDMALWLIGHIHDPDHARMTRKILQYDPTPPYGAEV